MNDPYNGDQFQQALLHRRGRRKQGATTIVNVGNYTMKSSNPIYIPSVASTRELPPIAEMETQPRRRAQPPTTWNLELKKKQKQSPDNLGLTSTSCDSEEESRMKLILLQKTRERLDQESLQEELQKLRKHQQLFPFLSNPNFHPNHYKRPMIRESGEKESNDERGRSIGKKPVNSRGSISARNRTLYLPTFELDHDDNNLSSISSSSSDIQNYISATNKTTSGSVNPDACYDDDNDIIRAWELEKSALQNQSFHRIVDMLPNMRIVLMSIKKSFKSDCLVDVDRFLYIIEGCVDIVARSPPKEKCIKYCLSEGCCAVIPSHTEFDLTVRKSSYSYYLNENIARPAKLFMICSGKAAGSEMELMTHYEYLSA
jgi:hypothetical protein